MAAADFLKSPTPPARVTRRKRAEAKKPAHAKADKAKDPMKMATTKTPKRATAKKPNAATGAKVKKITEKRPAKAPRGEKATTSVTGKNNTPNKRTSGAQLRR